MKGGHVCGGIKRFKIVNDYMCAPKVNYVDGSCISVDILEDMVQIYNKHKTDKILLDEIKHMKLKNPSGYKKNIVRLLTQKLSSECQEQTCWLSIPMFKDLSTKENTSKLHEYTFLPIGPRNSHEWLNTLHINDVFKQYEELYNDFIFLGAHPRDFAKLHTKIPSKLSDFKSFEKKNKKRIGIVFNLDTSRQSGSHWVSMFANLEKGQIYYIDSVGSSPKDEFKKLMNLFSEYYKSKGISADARVGTKAHQRGDSECGVYSISFILRFLDGETFDEIEATRVTDSEIATCRREYFGGEQK